MRFGDARPGLAWQAVVCIIRYDQKICQSASYVLRSMHSVQFV